MSRAFALQPACRGGFASAYEGAMIRSHHRLCVAPMMEWTDRHCRTFHRMLTRRTLLYTEMETTGAILHGDRERLLALPPGQNPVALQIGGSDARALAEAARIGASFGYDEINLNVGCPSDRVQRGRFGAALMAEPKTVARGVAAMIDAVPAHVLVSVKCRIGIDDLDSSEHLARFVERVAEAGCRLFIVHARKAWLQGLSPKENRTAPPLDHERVHWLKRTFPELTIVLNGGIESLDEARAHLGAVDGVMLGRAAYHNPWLLAEADARIFGEAGAALTRRDVVQRLAAYIDAERARGVRLHQITRHVLGLYHGRPGARAFRRHLSENAHREGAGPEVLIEAMEMAESAARPSRAFAAE